MLSGGGEAPSNGDSTSLGLVKSGRDLLQTVAWTISLRRVARDMPDEDPTYAGSSGFPSEMRATMSFRVFLPLALWPSWSL